MRGNRVPTIKETTQQPGEIQHRRSIWKDQGHTVGERLANLRECSGETEIVRDSSRNKGPAGAVSTAPPPPNKQCLGELAQHPLICLHCAHPLTGASHPHAPARLASVPERGLRPQKTQQTLLTLRLLYPVGGLHPPSPKQEPIKRSTPLLALCKLPPIGAGTTPKYPCPGRGELTAHTECGPNRGLAADS